MFISISQSKHCHFLFHLVTCRGYIQQQMTSLIDKGEGKCACSLRPRIMPVTSQKLYKHSLSQYSMSDAPYLSLFHLISPQMWWREQTVKLLTVRCPHTLCYFLPLGPITGSPWLLYTFKSWKWARSVGIATDYRLDSLGSNPYGEEIFPPSRPALGPTQPPVQWEPSLSRR